jgi:hypothetical protein
MSGAGGLDEVEGSVRTVAICPCMLAMVACRRPTCRCRASTCTRTRLHPGYATAPGSHLFIAAPAPRRRSRRERLPGVPSVQQPACLVASGPFTRRRMPPERVLAEGPAGEDGGDSPPGTDPAPSAFARKLTGSCAGSPDARDDGYSGRPLRPVPASAAPVERVAPGVPGGRRPLDARLDLLPGLEPPTFRASDRGTFHHGSIRFR